MKVCSKCGKEKPVTEFNKAPQCVQGVRPECKVCYGAYHAVKQKERNTKFPERRRSVVLKHKYGLTLAEFTRLLQEQDGRCAICGSVDPGPKGVFAVDHDHQKGGVRGLLCYLCNMGLGSFRDSKVILNSAIGYIGRYGY